MKEEKLIKALAGGDPDALDRIVKKYTGYVLTVARNFSRGALSDADIDEISVEVFYKLWSVRDRLDIRAGLPAYLSAAARNAVKNRFRDMPPESADISELSLPSGFSVEEAAELGEMTRCLSDGLQMLADDEREIFLRFYLYGEKTSQIARVTGKSEASVRTGLHRTRKKLKEYLTERGFENV